MFGSNSCPHEFYLIICQDDAWFETVVADSKEAAIKYLSNIWGNPSEEPGKWIVRNYAWTYSHFERKFGWMQIGNWTINELKDEYYREREGIQS